MERTVVRCVWVILLGWSASVLGGGYATVSRNYTVDAIQRTTLHSYPDGGSAQPLPLLLVLHGDGGNAAGIRAALPLEAQANGAAAFSYLSAQGGTFEYWTDAGRGHEGRFVQAIIANYGVAGITIDPARAMRQQDGDAGQVPGTERAHGLAFRTAGCEPAEARTMRVPRRRVRHRWVGA